MHIQVENIQVRASVIPPRCRNPREICVALPPVAVVVEEREVRPVLRVGPSVYFECEGKLYIHGGSAENLIGDLRSHAQRNYAYGDIRPYADVTDRFVRDPLVKAQDEMQKIADGYIASKGTLYRETAEPVIVLETDCYFGGPDYITLTTYENLDREHLAGTQCRMWRLDQVEDARSVFQDATKDLNGDKYRVRDKLDAEVFDASVLRFDPKERERNIIRNKLENAVRTLLNATRFNDPDFRGKRSAFEMCRIDVEDELPRLVAAVNREIDEIVAGVV